MMTAYRIWTWIAIALLGFGSIAVFIVFLATSLRHLAGGKNPAGRSTAPEDRCQVTDGGGQMTDNR